MLIVHLNYWAILGAAVVNMVIGAVWYAPLVFGKIWMKAAGIKASNMKSSSSGYIVQFVATLLMVYVLAHFLRYAGAMDWMSGAVVGFWAWLGFVATTSVMLVLWEKRSINVYIINCSEILVTLLVSGAILGIWR